MRIKRVMALSILIVILTQTALSDICHTTGFMITVPVDRIIKNTTAYIQQNPEDAHGLYTLARCHYFAFINKSFKIGGHESNRLPELYNIDNVKEYLFKDRAREIVLKEKGLKLNASISYEQHQSLEKAIAQKIKELKEQNWQPPMLSNEQAIEHANLALENFTTALKLDDTVALYHLGFAAFLEKYVEFLKSSGSDAIPEALHSIILEKSKETYYLAHMLTIKADLKLDHFPLLSHEAGDGFIRLAKLLGITSKEGEKRVKDVSKNIEKLKKHEVEINKKLLKEAVMP